MSTSFSWIRTPDRRRNVSVGIALIVWCSIYGFRAFKGHLALRTNAYDLSVFDYALWSTGRAGLGYVPFLGQSIFSHHFMPTLLVLWPAYQIVPSPALLIALQLFAFAVAAALLYGLLPTDLPALPVTAIIVAFLFGRRSHSAVTSVFYIESLEPLLIFLMVLTWRAGRRVLATGWALLALGCKEDMAVYIAAFGASVVLAGSRRAGAALVAGSLLWLLVAVAVAIPASRVHDHLPAANPFIDASLGSRDALQQTAEYISVLGGGESGHRHQRRRWLPVLASP